MLWTLCQPIIRWHLMRSKGKTECSTHTHSASASTKHSPLLSPNAKVSSSREVCCNVIICTENVIMALVIQPTTRVCVGLYSAGGLKQPCTVASYKIFLGLVHIYSLFISKDDMESTRRKSSFATWSFQCLMNCSKTNTIFICMIYLFYKLITNESIRKNVFYVCI